MATPATAAKKTNPNTPSTAVLTQEQINDALRAAGMMEDSGEQFHRIKLNGMSFEAGDEVYVSNPKTKAPAFLAQIVRTPQEYQAKWFDDDGLLARAVGRPEIAGKMCKSHFGVSGQNREFSEDGTSCRDCPVNPFAPKDSLPIEAQRQKCSWRGDIELRILNDDHTLVDDTIWTLSLPTTGMIEFKGMSRNPEAGHVGELNFMQKLARLGSEGNAENPTAGLMRALTALQLGGVIAEVRSVPVTSDSGNRYHVVQFTPIEILDVEAQPALETAASADAEDDGVPF